MTRLVAASGMLVIEAAAHAYACGELGRAQPVEHDRAGFTGHGPYDLPNRRRMVPRIDGMRLTRSRRQSPHRPIFQIGRALVVSIEMATETATSAVRTMPALRPILRMDPCDPISGHRSSACCSHHSCSRIAYRYESRHWPRCRMCSLKWASRRMPSLSRMRQDATLRTSAVAEMRCRPSE